VPLRRRAAEQPWLAGIKCNSTARRCSSERYLNAR
jgi:hypothetical protein